MGDVFEEQIFTEAGDAALSEPQRQAFTSISLEVRGMANLEEARAN